MGDSSESVILGEKDLKRDVGIQASVPDVKGKHDDADDSDDEDVKKEKLVPLRFGHVEVYKIKEGKR